MTFGERLGGAENMLMTFLRHVDRSRVEPTVVFFAPGPFEREVAALGIDTLVFVPGRFRDLHREALAIARLARALRRLRPDLVLAWLTRDQLYVGPAALAAGMAGRVVWWQHLLAGGRLDRVATLLPAKAIGTSSHGAAMAQQRMRPSRPTFTVHPGIDAPEPGDPARAAALREQLGIPAGRLVATNVARLQPWKGQPLLLHATAALRDRGADVHALFVGGDAHGLAPEYGPQLRRTAAELGIEDRVTFAGQVADPGPLLGVTDVLVNLAALEPFGIAMVEAMALGLPVVAVDAVGPREIVVDGATGRIVPAAPTALADALEELARDGDLRARMGAAGRARFAERFTAARMAAEIEERIERLARG
jgi:glycosyltransferase involved in cell wall biosynthesis